MKNSLIHLVRRETIIRNDGMHWDNALREKGYEILGVI